MNIGVLSGSVRADLGCFWGDFVGIKMPAWEWFLIDTRVNGELGFVVWLNHKVEFKVTSFTLFPCPWILRGVQFGEPWRPG